MTDIQTLYELTHPVFAEAQSRPVRFTKVEVIHLKQDKKQPALAPGLPGSLILYIAKQGSRTLDELRIAFREGGDRLAELVERLARQYQDRKEVSVEEAVQATIRQPVFADLLYGNAALTHGLFMPDDLEIAVLILAYNGGRLASGGFKLAQYYREDSDAALEAFIVRTDPSLTAAERAALAKVPSDQLLYNLDVASVPACDYTWWAAAAITVATCAWVFALANITAVAATVARDETHLSEEELKELDPSTSARKLLEIRRKALLGMGRA